MYYGLKRNELAAQFSEKYHQVHPDDGWAALIVAAYHSQPRLTADQYKDGKAQAQAAIKADPRFNRGRRLLARIQMLQHDYSGGRATLQELDLALPGDPGIKLLREQLDSSEKADAQAKDGAAPK